MMQVKISKSLQQAILTAFGDNITGPNDLTGNTHPSAIFYLLVTLTGYLLNNNPERVLTSQGMILRRKLHSVIINIGSHFLSGSQVFENRNVLLKQDTSPVEPDKDIPLPNKPVIWISNHAFKDDTLASILAAKRHAYIMFGSLPRFFNTFDGLTAYLNGVIMVNRKIKESKHASIAKAVKAIEMGTDLLMFPEGVWNKTPDKLLLDLWPGVYQISRETGAEVVPIVHYTTDCSGLRGKQEIHTVIDNPIKISELSQEEALIKLRDTMATWLYLMMEKYGRSTRHTELDGFNDSISAWRHQVEQRVKTAGKYDTEIETSADFRPKNKCEPETVWRTVADIQDITAENAISVIRARQLISDMEANDFQHRF